jgi:hypothetical protein
MIMRELAKEIDGYRYSVYFYKNHEEDDNKIHMGPVWDFNLGYGNVDFSTSGAEDPRGWLWNLEKGRIFWFLRALDDKTFADLMDCRWRHVRKTTLTNEKIEKIIDDAIAHMDSAEYRNHYTWKTIGRYVWPNNFVGETYEEEVEYFKNWMWERIEWMDIYLPGTCQVPIAHVSEDETQEFSSSLFPNPGNGKFDIWSSSEMKSLRIYNMQGALIETIELNNQLSFRYALPSQSPGMYLIQVQLNNGALENHRYVYTR